MKKDWFYIVIIAALLIAAVLCMSNRKPCPEQACPELVCPEQTCPEQTCPELVCPGTTWLDAWEQVESIREREREEEVKKAAPPVVAFEYHACYPYFGDANSFSGICTRIIHIFGRK